jgi:uncharacterized protein YjbJ (UPF0337 family)
VVVCGENIPAGEETMNRDTLKGQWRQLQGSIKKRWAKLTDDELTEIDGNFDTLVGRIQERYGYRKEQAERELNDFLAPNLEPREPRSLLTESEGGSG